MTDSEELTVESVNRELNEEMAEGLARSVEEFVSKFGDLPSWQLPIFRAGHWLGERMKREGANTAEVEIICDRLGKYTRLFGVETVYQSAIVELRRWRTKRFELEDRERSSELSRMLKRYLGKNEGDWAAFDLELLRASQTPRDRETGERLTKNFEALLDALERSDGALRFANAEVIKLADEVERWKEASGLERGGDPDGVTPEAVRRRRYEGTGRTWSRRCTESGGSSRI